MTEGKDKKAKRFYALLLLLVASGVVINLWQRAGEQTPPRRALKEFPSSVGSWRKIGDDYRFDAETERVLRADDYLSRNYTSDGRRVANLYVGYYATQRNGATYHSPLNCLPGTGWTMSEPGKITISPSDGSAPFEANRYIIEQAGERQLMIYWYQGRGRAVASEYWGKIYTVLDSIGRRRSDGAMVRVMVPLQKREAEQSALEGAANLASEVAPLLSGYVPN
ncbi:MAG TPA: EpsI family protein [Pyrinomonadaceae bacterium]|nr:EpsI family protein [Pyrinomonadaceae bacterium]